MQHKSNPVRLAETLAQTSAPVFGLFHRRQVELAAARRLATADFYAAYYPLFVFSLFLALLAQTASMVSAYGYFEAELSGYALLIAAGFSVVLLEAAKYFVMNRLFADLFRLAGMQLPYGLATAAPTLRAPKAAPRNIGFTFAWQQANESGKSDAAASVNTQTLNNESDNETGNNRSGKENPESFVHVPNLNNRSGCTALGLRTCKHCGKSFERNHKVQQYCAKSCKVAAWELRTGKKFIPRRKAKSPALTLFP